MPSRLKKPESTLGSILELVFIVGVALALALGIQAFLVKPYRIPSGSMLPTLQEGQRVLVNRIGHSFMKPEVGDVVVFHPPVGAAQGDCAVDPPQGSVCTKANAEESEENFIKRVVAGPGDTIRIVEGRVIRNGKPAKEPFITPCGSGSLCEYPTPFKVPADHYFMMGDNRGASEDSRFWGPVPDEWIIGGAFATYWPIDRIGLL